MFVGVMDVSNKLCIQSVVRVGPPLSRRGVEHSKCEKPCWLSIDSIMKVTVLAMPIKRDTMLATDVGVSGGGMLRTS